ncbi:MAG: phosphatase PAP2 family protein [Pseudomonadota bacterium]
MQISQTPPPSRNQTPALFWWILGTFVVLSLIPTVWTELDVRAAATFLGPGSYPDVVHWWWVELINLYVPALFRTVVFVALGALVWASARPIGKRWRLLLAFVVLAGALGPGLLVNSGFKENWQRARPYQVTVFGGTQQFSRATVLSDQCNNNCSFVSGHVACGFFLASLMLVDRRRRVVWGTTGVVAGLTIGFARMADGAHWLSDVLWASPITLFCSWLVWKLLLRLYPE